jgi:hypothetical protein
VIRTLHRARGASALGASRDGDRGPFGIRGLADEEQLLDEDDDQDDEPTSAIADTDH